MSPFLGAPKVRKGSTAGEVRSRELTLRVRRVVCVNSITLTEE